MIEGPDVTTKAVAGPEVLCQPRAREVWLLLLPSSILTAGVMLSSVGKGVKLDV